MPAVGSLPSLLQIENLDTRYLADLADQFTTEADLVEGSFSQAHQQLKDTNWRGQANDAALNYTNTARAAARSHSQSLRDAAGVARTGGANLLAVQRDVLGLVDDARRAGFIVGDDLAVSAYAAGRPIADAMILQPQANSRTADIRAHVSMLVSVDRDVAASLDAVTAGFHEIKLTDMPGTPFDELPPLPPPLPPGENDDPWQHRGDRRWSSVASSGLKQKLVALALLEMERNSQPTAGKLLNHYLENSGDPVELPTETVDRWLSNTARALPPCSGHGICGYAACGSVAVVWLFS